MLPSWISMVQSQPMLSSLYTTVMVVRLSMRALCPIILIRGCPGGTVAKFAGQNVHKRLLTEESYKEKAYDTALKKAFLGTDEDLLASESDSPSSLLWILTAICYRSGTHARSFGLHSGGSAGHK